MGSPNTLPIAFDDGTSAHVPMEKVADALKDGGKVVQSMRFDDGSSAWVPLDKVHDALKDGGMVIGAPPRLPDVGNVNEGIPKSGRAGKAMVPGMGGPPMLMDVPEGSEVGTEQTAQEGYQTGAKIGLASMPIPPAGEAASYGAGYGIEALNAMVKAHPFAGQALKILAKGALYGGGFAAGAKGLGKHILNLVGSE